ncbi:MAG: RNA-binding protein [Nanoarchaeota archaeon]|nr:RNA-binding protein [Nanoarchaeota archaeon]MBU1644115.1 RNA-binding protein [Nanoarchaeota archaeon]MBU1976450.1 RNA-binding protein [Nanoarchaeota archaeon]
MEAKLCSSTKKRIDNDSGAVKFLCPNCSKHEIVRSTFARQNAIKYVCPACEFTGPN